MSSQEYCSECGELIETGSAFCGACGAKVEAGTQSVGDPTPTLVPSGDPTPISPGEPEETVAVGPVSPEQLDVGSRVAGFEIKELIDRGGMGIVYRAHDLELHRDVALKIISPGLADDDRFRRRFIAESRAVASLDDPYILPVYQSGEQNGLLFLAAKLVPGGDLKGLLRQEGRLDTVDVATVVSQVGQALDAAHAKGLIHRDVKPANILIGSDDGPLHCYLTDFGLIKGVTEATDITATGEVLGTVDYMAPEQIEGQEVDQRVDVYALGCMAIELLSGTPPFRRETKRDTMLAQLTDDPVLPKGLSPTNDLDLARIIGKAVAKSPDERYDSCGQFANELADHLDVTPDLEETLAIPTSTVMPSGPEKPKRKSKGILAGLAVVAVLAAGAGGYILASNTGNNSPDNFASRNVIPEPGKDGTTGATGATGIGTTTAETGPTGDEDGPGSDDDNPYDDLPTGQVATLEGLYEAEKFSGNSVLVRSAESISEYVDYRDEGYPQVGKEEFKRGMVFELDHYDDRVQDLKLPLSEGWTSFEADIGLITSQEDQSKTGVTILASSEAGEVRKLKELGMLTPGLAPKKINLPIHSKDTQLIFRFELSTDATADPLVVFGKSGFRNDSDY